MSFFVSKLSVKFNEDAVTYFLLWYIFFSFHLPAAHFIITQDNI